MVFSRDYCPFCKATKDKLTEKGIEFKAVEMDLIPDGHEMHAALKKMINKRTVPQTFVNKKLIGGNDDLQAAVKNGSFDKMLANTA